MNTGDETIMKMLKGLGVVLLILGIAIAGWRFLLPERGYSYAVPGTGSNTAAVALIRGEVQEVAIDLQASAYAPIIVQKGIPVKFNIRADERTINGCNDTVVIPEYNVQKTLKPGDNILEFTPAEVGTFAYSCWMGMVVSSIEVVEDLSQADPSAVAVPVGRGVGMPCCIPQQ